MHTSFSKDAWSAFRQDDRPGPVHMLNLIRLRKWADYGDSRKVTGREAYAAYGLISAPVFARLGGRIVWRGGFEQMLIGPEDEAWDISFIAEYPGVSAFADMVRDPVYREAMAHRQAGVEDSRLVRFRPESGGAGFAG